MVIGAAIEVHRVLGPGLLESVYERCLCYEVRRREIECERQVTLPVVYRGHTLEQTFVVDLLVPVRLIIEVKAVEQLNPVHEAQLVTYMKLSGIRLGLLLNFNVAVLKEGIRRMIL